MNGAILERFVDVKPNGNGWMARCPAHDDRRQSLSIGKGDDGRWLLRCHAGCSFESILAAAQLETRDLFPDRESHQDRQIVATYDYPDEVGTLLYQVVRFAPKDFRQRRPDGKGGWSWNLNGTRRVLYRLPLLKDRATVAIAEGEKDVERLSSIGIPATTNAGGAGKWRAEFAQTLKQAGCKHVIVLPDNDPPGEAHGRTIARSCIDVGLDVKLIALPGLAHKGDVSDFLEQHSKEELLELFRNAPLFNPARSVAAEIPIELTSLSDLLGEAETHIDYLVEDRVPAGALVLFVAAPKTGKSHSARELAFAVSRGEPWLGWRTSKGAVWLLAFEDKRAEIRKHLRDLGATGKEPIGLFMEQAPANLWPKLHELAAKESPALIIVDTLARCLGVKDFSDYAEVTSRFEPLLKLTRTTGATLLLLHHSSIHAERKGLDAVLGSTALPGSVDNVLILKRTEDQQRILSSIQRIGPDLEPTVIVLNRETGRLERAGTKRQFDDADLSRRITEALAGESEPVHERWIQEHVEGRNQDKVRVLRRLVGMGAVLRLGAGGQRDPYRYRLNLCSRDSESRDVVPETAGTEVRSMQPTLYGEIRTSVPDVPIRNIGNRGGTRETYVPPTSSSHRVNGVDSPVPVVPVVPVVPDAFRNVGAGLSASAKRPSDRESNLCSNDEANDDERF